MNRASSFAEYNNASSGSVGVSFKMPVIERILASDAVVINTIVAKYCDHLRFDVAFDPGLTAASPS
jgi:hypothetical protein